VIYNDIKIIGKGCLCQTMSE